MNKPHNSCNPPQQSGNSWLLGLIEKFALISPVLWKVINFKLVMTFSTDKTLDSFCNLFGYHISLTTSYFNKAQNLSYLQHLLLFSRNM